MVDWHPLKRWLFTTNHKDVGILYLFTSLYFFVAAGLLALTFRTQLAFPSSTFLQPDEYNQAVTTHGLLMLLSVLSARCGVRQLLRADSDRRARHGVPPAERAELFGLPLQ